MLLVNLNISSTEMLQQWTVRYNQALCLQERHSHPGVLHWEARMMRNDNCSVCCAAGARDGAQQRGAAAGERDQGVLPDHAHVHGARVQCVPLSKPLGGLQGEPTHQQLMTPEMRYQRTRAWHAHLCRVHIECTLGVYACTVQVLVDISTPAGVFDRVDAAVGAHTSLHAGEFTGKRLVCARDAGEPLKYALCVFYEFPHNGGGPFHHAQQA